MPIEPLAIDCDAWDSPPVDPNYASWVRRIPRADLKAWSKTPAPSREWVLDEWIPMQQCTYLTGPGAAGKSLLAQQLCTCVALGVPFMGTPVRQSRALYVSCEDDFDELHRRQAAICKRLGISMGDLDGKLEISSQSGLVGNELATFNERISTDEFGNTCSLIRPTTTYHALNGLAKADKYGFIALDNVAHLFAGNENIRVEVAAFLALMNSLAQTIGGAILLIGHPNKQGDSYSGSTAWENQARSRLFMERAKTSEGDVIDPDLRVLRREKANYANNGAEISFRWLEWSFVRDQDLPNDLAERLAQTAQATADNDLFLQCLDKVSGERRTVSPSTAAKNYAPRVFAKMTTAKGATVHRLERAMERLLHLGEIKGDQPVHQRANRTWATGLARANERD
jgi:RecA-family ATPase